MNQIRDNRLSYLRAVACIAIVILHTTYIANITFTDSYGVTGNIASNIARNLMLWAVPNFVMVTGALLLGPEKKITLEKLFGKYILRMLLALVIFCVIYQVFDSWLIDGDLGLSSVIKGIKEALTAGSWSTLWYPYLLIALYLLLPFYKMIAEKAMEREYLYLLAVYLLFMSILPILGIWKLNSGFYITVSSIYQFYLFFGYGIYSGKIRIQRSLGVIMAVMGSILTVIFTIIRWQRGAESLEMFRDYNAFNVVLQSCGIFAAVFGKGSESREASNEGLADSPREVKGLLGKLFLNLDENSFGIYLIHIIIIKWLFRVANFDTYLNGGAVSFILIIAAILMASWLIVFLLRKLKIVSKIL